MRRRRTTVNLTADEGELSQERETLQKVAQEPKKPVKSKPEKEPPRKKVIDKAEKSAYIDLKKTPIALTPDEELIVAALKDGQRLVDDVIAQSGKAAGVILASLTLLEVKGIVRRLPGRFVELTGK